MRPLHSQARQRRPEAYGPGRSAAASASAWLALGRPAHEPAARIPAMVYRVTLIPGDGIGPELAAATKRVLDASGVDFDWEVVEAGEAVLAREGTPLPQSVLDSILRNKVAIKGPITTPVGVGFRSVNVALRQTLGLYANVRPVRSIPGLVTRYENVDLVIVRENTEDLYAGIEHMVGPDAAESIKIITRAASERIARYAFEYAVANGRSKVTAVHKANIMKFSDGLFLESCRTIAAQYEGRIAFEDRIVDNMCMQLVQKPELYDVLVLPNLYGDIVSDLCAGLVGGLGVAPGANIGPDAAVFEAVHGSAPKYAGQNKANPTALMLSGVLLLRHIGEQAAAKRVEDAIRAVIAEGRTVTYDLGGSAGTSEFADAIVARLESVATTGA
jgi:isocitrate dehydrogenase (NAD+)